MAKGWRYDNSRLRFATVMREMLDAMERQEWEPARVRKAMKAALDAEVMTFWQSVAGHDYDCLWDCRAAPGEARRAA